ncbi:MAG: septum formation initiator family protein [Chloroflexi bacterium]|nr:septum formation initiator family protein [Chloroflexota bacterium]
MMELEEKYLQRKQYLASLQLMFTIALTLGMLLAFQFAKRLSDSRPLLLEFEQTKAEVATLEAERDQLSEELAFIQTDAYVEIWARSEAKMLLPGETLVVPKLTAAEQAAEANQEQEAKLVSDAVIPALALEEPNTIWQLWWQLFFSDSNL